MNRQALYLALSGALLAAAGCSLAPSYNRPPAPTPAQWPALGTNAVAVADTNAPTARDLEWRAVFTDSNLQQIVTLAIASNRDLRLAVRNVERARALYGVQRAAMLPALNADASINRQRIPADLSGAGRRRIASDDSVMGVASWEPDFFGLLRSQSESARQQYLASAQAQRNVAILIVESVAQNYLALATDRTHLTLARDTLRAQLDSLRVVEGKRNAMLTSEIDVQRARTQVESARVDVATYTQRVALDRDALDLLAGAPVPDAWLPEGLEKVVPPATIAAGMPSDVLLERPDVLAAENMLRAAYADIGAARAAFFPRILLTGGFGTASHDLSGLFERGSAAWNYVTPQITMPIFDPSVWAYYKVSKAQREIALTQYEKTIQAAFRDVADTLAVRATVDEQIAAQEALVSAVDATYRLAQSRYDKGLDNYLSVLDAQRSLYTAQQGLVALQLSKVANDVQFYAVLGGGWQAADEAAKAMSAAKADANASAKTEKTGAVAPTPEGKPADGGSR